MKSTLLLSVLSLAAAGLFAPDATAQEHKPAAAIRRASDTELALADRRGSRSDRHRYGSSRGRSHRSVARIGVYSTKHWVPGHFELRAKRVWVPASKERVWIEPIYETRVDYRGRTYRVLVCEGRWELVVRPAHFEERSVRVWVGGCWSFGTHGV